MYKNYGWVRDFADVRDLTPDHPEIAPLLAKTSYDAVAPVTKVDLRQWCSPIKNQSSLGSCSANAAVSMVEYLERKSFGKHIDGSRLFVYKTTRNLLQWTGDTGAFLRTAMGALALFGCPPEQYWPYDITQFDVEPSAFVYSFAQSFQALKYYRLDSPTTTRPALLQSIKSTLASGIPLMMGFTVYDSIGKTGIDGRIPYPVAGDKVSGGHAIMIVGFDDTITNIGSNTPGALLLRNSWGPWGLQNSGYGWLPYDYVLQGLTADWWALISQEWVDTGVFAQ